MTLISYHHPVQRNKWNFISALSYARKATAGTKVLFQNNFVSVHLPHISFPIFFLLSSAISLFVLLQVIQLHL
jgi:hypothetical protein